MSAAALPVSDLELLRQTQEKLRQAQLTIDALRVANRAYARQHRILVAENLRYSTANERRKQRRRERLDRDWSLAITEDGE